MKLKMFVVFQKRKNLKNIYIINTIYSNILKHRDPYIIQTYYHRSAVLKTLI